MWEICRLCLFLWQVTSWWWTATSLWKRVRSGVWREPCWDGMAHQPRKGKWLAWSHLLVHRKSACTLGLWTPCTALSGQRSFSTPLCEFFAFCPPMHVAEGIVFMTFPFVCVCLCVSSHRRSWLACSRLLVSASYYIHLSSLWLRRQCTWYHCGELCNLNVLVAISKG